MAEEAPKVEETSVVAADTPTLLEDFDKPVEQAAEQNASPAGGETPVEAPEVAPEAEKPPEEPAKASEESAPEDKAVDNKADAKPAEKPKDEAVENAKVVEPTPESVEPADYSVLAVPEHLTPNTEVLGNFTGLLGEHHIPPEVGQRLLDLHGETIKSAGEQLARKMADDQQRVFADTRREWANQVKADPELGGNGFQTAMGKIARVRDLLVPEEERQAFSDMLRVTGVGDHPQFLRILHRAAGFFDEPASPPPDARPAGTQQKKGMRALYTHNRSPGA